MAHTTANVTELTRAEVWSSQLKEILRDELMATRYVRILTEFPDGDTFKIPSIGATIVNNYTENTQVAYNPLDLGQFQFTITEYLSAGTYITKKAKQDIFYMNELVSKFVPEQERAIMEYWETAVLSTPENAVGGVNSSESIDGIAHRVAGGNAGKIEVADFAYALYALKKAAVPQRDLVAIVDPSVEFQINTLTNIVDVSNNPRWEGIVSDGIATGMRFVKNIFGFDVYTSNFLPNVADNALATRTGTAVDFSVVNGKPAYFFSAAANVQPMVGAWRQEPEVDYEYNKDFQRDEYVTTARFGTALFRPENMVTVVTSPVLA